MERKAIIGVMGGDHSVGAEASDAKFAGALLTRAQSILLTGGRCMDGTEVKNAAMKGAKDAHSLNAPARLIGILPGGPRDWDETQERSLFLSTNLNHKQRDAINGVTPDVLIFFAGSCGTLCELAFALQAKKPILFWRAAQILNDRYFAHTTMDSEVDAYLASALDACRTKLGLVSGLQSGTTVSSLRVTLGRGLAGAEDFSGELCDLVAESIGLAETRSVASGFPGFCDDPNSKERFEQIVRRISR